ncbi:MAG: HD domain-containing phosphohydrolase [Bdellovibrionales bacterium]
MASLLLVEDDQYFRSALKKVLSEKGWSIVEAPDGKVARDILKATPRFDVILSDIQLPHLTGVELLQWVKESKPTPVVLMTGFARILETTRAHELGADEFLTKPFEMSDLLAVLKKFAPRPADDKPAVPAEIESAEFCKVSLEDFVSSSKIVFDVFVQLGSRFLRIGRKGEPVPVERFLAYREKGLKYLFVRRDDFRNLVKFNLHLTKTLKANASVAKEKKKNFLRYTGEVLLEKAFVAGMNTEAVLEAKDFLITSLDLLADESETFELIESFNSHSDHVYAHSLCVSTYATMIAKAMDWKSSANLFKLALCGLFHDIGKKEIDRSILDKPRHKLTAAERKVYETHPTRGREILATIKHIPNEVIAVTYEHHEDNLGRGFPRNISRKEIHPFTQIVRVANLFANLVIRTPFHEGMSPPDAIEHILIHYGDSINPEPYDALKKLFDPGILKAKKS